MIELPSGLWVDVVSHLWQTTIALGVLALLSLVMRRAPARFLNALWWIGLAKLLVPARVVAPIVRRAIDPIAAASAGLELPSITVWLDRAAPVLDPAAAGRQAGSAGAGIAGAVLAGLWTVGAVWLVVSLVRARRNGLVGATALHHELPPPLAVRLRAAIEGTGVPASAVRVASAPVMPATIGILRRAIVIPEVLITRLDTPELRAVLLHEDAHRRRLDPLQAAVRRVAAVAFYFFPLLWPLLARLKETSEMACDEAAIRRGVAPSDYARALARTMSIGLEPLGLSAALARGTPSLTRRRFDRLAQGGRFVLMRKHWLCIAIAALSVIAISATGLALADRGELSGGPGREITKEQAKGFAKAVAKGTARAIAATASGEAVREAAAEEKAAVEEAAAEQEAEAAEAEGAAESAAAEKAAEEEQAAAEAAAAKEEADAEEKTYTITLEEIVDPKYPEDAKKDGVGGKVTLKLTLSPDGGVADVWTLEEVEGYPSLGDAAELAARKWTFKIDGEPEEEVEVIVPVEFKLRGEKTMEMSVRIPDEAETPDEPDEPETPDEPDEPVPPDAPEPEDPPAEEEVPEPEEP
jgi:TonB family protein